MIAQVFADSSYYIALANPRDQYHEVAVGFTRSFRGRVVTTEYVLLEVGNRLVKANDRQAFLALLHHLMNSHQVEVVNAEHSLFQQGIERFRNASDKFWSLTDCISFAVMDQRGLTEALTMDHHFRQAGYHPLLA